MRRVALFGLFGVIAAIAVLAAPADAEEKSIRTIRVGACISVSGEFQVDGEVILAGIRMRIEEFNENNEIDGVKLELFHRDDHSTTEGAIHAFDDLMQIDRVDAIIGPMPSALMLAIRPLAAKYGVVAVSPWATHPSIGRDNDWCFRILFDDEFQGAALARYVRKNLGLQRAAAIVNDRAEYSRSAYNAFQHAFLANGGEIVATERYRWLYNEEENNQDFAGMLAAIGNANPDVVFLPVYTPEVAVIIRESLQVNKPFRFCGGDTWQSDEVFLSAGKNIENAFYLSGANFSSSSDAMQRFMDVFENSHELYAQPFSVLGYDCLSLLIKAMENGFSRADIREGLFTINNFELASGNISIDRQKGVKKRGYIYNIEKQGDAFVPVLGASIE